MLNYQRVNHLSTVNHHSITIPKSRKGASAAWATKVGPPGLKPAACGGKKAAMLAVNSLELSMGNTMGKYHPFQTWTMMWKLYLLDLRKTMVSLGVVFSGIGLHGIKPWIKPWIPWISYGDMVWGPGCHTLVNSAESCYEPNIWRPTRVCKGTCWGIHKEAIGLDRKTKVKCSVFKR